MTRLCPGTECPPCRCPGPRPRGRMVFKLGPAREAPAVVKPTPQFYRFPLLGDPVMALQMTDSQQVEVTAAFLDKRGNPAPVDGAPVWMTDNPNVIALTPSADGKACTVVAVGPLGTAKVTMTADADLGEGKTDILGTLDFEIVSGAAVTVTLTPGVPTEQP